MWNAKQRICHSRLIAKIHLGGGFVSQRLMETLGIDGAMTTGQARRLENHILKSLRAESPEQMDFAGATSVACGGNAEALALIDEHKRVGRKVVIISSSPEEIVKPLARYLGVDHVIATRARIDDEGRYTGEMEFYAYAEGKAEAMRELAAAEGLSLPDSFAYSDSVTDLPMLEAVGHPVVVNPDKELAQIGEERDWLTMDFERPVTIRTRLATLPRPVPLISGAALAGAVGGAIVLWALRVRQRAS